MVSLLQQSMRDVNECLRPEGLSVDNNNAGKALARNQTEGQLLMVRKGGMRMEVSHTSG